MSYAFAKRFSKNADRFGKGELEGVVAPETAAHAAGVAAMLPMLTLGIPGSPTAAVMLGGLIIWGLQPGPLLFKGNPDFVWGLIVSMYTGIVLGVLRLVAGLLVGAAIGRWNGVAIGGREPVFVRDPGHRPFNRAVTVILPGLAREHLFGDLRRALN